MWKEIRLRVLACKIEWHWLFIMPGRKKGSRIMDELWKQGQPLNSRKLLSLNRRVSRRCLRVTLLTERYMKLAGIRPCEWKVYESSKAMV